MKIVIVAGEVSGDILASGLIRELKSKIPDLQVSGIAGPLMIEQGCEPWFDMDELSVMGLVEVLGRLPRILKIRKQLKDTILQNPPDLFIGVDAPDFNLGLEETLKKQGIKTAHYVSPSVWAWKRKRVYKMKRALDLVMVFMPFEKAFFEQYQVPCRFVGHTLADQIPMHSDKLQAREALSLSKQGPFLAILPGSRSGEIKQLASVFLETAQRLQTKNPDLQLIVPLVNEKIAAQFNEIHQEQFPSLVLNTFIGQARQVLAASDVVLIASGTATLETMLIKRPMVVAYRVHALTYAIALRLVKTDFYSLPNLLAKKELVPELIQEHCNPDELTEALHKLLHSDNSELISAFSGLHVQIAQNADVKAAQAVIDVLNGEEI